MTGELRVSDLVLYPLKGAGGIPVSSFAFDRAGPIGDRRWMLVDDQGVFLSQRSFPDMVRIRPSLEPGAGGTAAPTLRLEHPGAATPLRLPLDPTRAGGRKAGDSGTGAGVSRDGASERGMEASLPGGGPATSLAVEIWEDRVLALAPAPEADRWFSEVLSHPCRAVFLPPEAARAVDPDRAPGSRVAFADGYPLLLVTQASLDALNARLDTPLPMDRFRPNVVVEGPEAPHDEDRWRRLRIGGGLYRGVKPCARCAVTTVDPSTGVRGDEPLRTLATYRRMDPASGKVYFGQNVVPESPARMRVGDPVEVLDSGDPRY